jgi:basic amino acid/polyamine antiporter, APA family
LLSVISLGLIITSTFDQIMTLLGFSLSLFTIMPVVGLIVLRFRMKHNGEPFYHTFGYPWVPFFFIIVEGGMALYVFTGKPVQSLIGIAVAATGFAIYLMINIMIKQET